MLTFLFSRTTVQFLQYYVTPCIQPSTIVAMKYSNFTNTVNPCSIWDEICKSGCKQFTGVNMCLAPLTTFSLLFLIQVGHG